MVVDEILNTVKHISGTSVFIPIICCAIKFKTLNVILRVLFFYLLLSLSMDFIGFIFTGKGYRTYLLYNTFTIIECTFLSLIFYLQFTKAAAKTWVKWLYVIFLVVAALIFLILDNYNKQDNYLTTFESLFLIALSVTYFLGLLQDLSIPKLSDFYFTWINAGILIYFSSTCILFLFQGHIEKMGDRMFNTLYSLHWVANIAFNILLAIGVWKFKPDNKKTIIS